MRVVGSPILPQALQQFADFDLQLRIDRHAIPPRGLTNVQTSVGTEVKDRGPLAAANRLDNDGIIGLVVNE